MDSQPPLPPTSFRISDIGSPTWPRRAAKACASCRRDKIRCDGARPCSGCVKKGYTADQCIDGCEHCRRARVRCEGGKPCARCREMQIDCADEPNATPFRLDPSSSRSSLTSRAGVRLKPTDRAKLACQNCRRDNKKCDDSRPCQRCIARGEDCIHVGRGPKLVKLRCEACRKENKKCEDARPCRSCIEEGKQCISTIRKGRGHGTRVKAACTNCRRDKIRCDGSRPCAPCSRKGYECQDRACKACTQKGQETQCTHRKNSEAGSDEDDAATDGIELEAEAQPSHVNPYEMPTGPSSMGGPPALGGPPPMGYPPLGYAVPQFYPPPPQAGVIPHQQASPMMHSSLYPPPDTRVAYYPVIDPNIDNPAPRMVASERNGGPSGRSV